MATESDNLISDHRDDWKTKDRTIDSKRSKRKFETGQQAESKPAKRQKSIKPQTASEQSTHTTSPVEQSPFYQETASLYLPVSPISQLHALAGLCAEHLSPLILTYYPPFGGVVLSYGNIRLSEESMAYGGGVNQVPVLAKSVDEYAVSFVWVTADFLLLKPQRGNYMEGWINLQNEGHLGMVCWNLFNASIEKKRLGKDWKWTGGSPHLSSKVKLKRDGHTAFRDGSEAEGEVAKRFDVQQALGHFEDAKGVAIGGLIRFMIMDFETSSSMDRERGFLGIEGTLLDEDEEEEKRKALTESDMVTGRSKASGLSTERVSRSDMSGALINGHSKGFYGEAIAI